MTSILNDGTTAMASEGDGVALQSVDHPVGPITTTEEMREAGAHAIVSMMELPTPLPPFAGGRALDLKGIAHAIYVAMADKEPYQDISDEALVETAIDLPFPPHLERFAIRAALGNNGGEWAEHYTEEQKEHWRRFVVDLIRDIRR